MTVQVSMKAIAKSYVTGTIRTRALSDVDLEIESGESVAIVGPSGSGKTTLLNLLGLLKIPSSGEYVLNGHATHALKDRQLAALRNQFIGFVFQGFNLIPELTVTENVALPLHYGPAGRAMDQRSAVRDMLDRLGLSGRADHLPSQLSGGQQQRVAIARAMITQPRLLLADEPTGNLDSEMAVDVLSLLREMCANGTSLVFVTHDESIARSFPRVVEVRDGKISQQSRRAAA